MKKNILMVMLVFGFAFFYSCTTDEVGPILEEITPSVLSSSASGDVVLLEEDSLNVFSDFLWTEAQANLDISMSYTLEMDTAGNDFADSETLEYSDPFMYIPIVKDVNSILIADGGVAGELSSYEYRVVTNVSGLDPIASNVIPLNITPYEAIVDYGTVHLLGDATIPGWDNLNALPLTHIGDGVFEITSDLLNTGGVKFLAILGQWAPQWGINTGTWESGTLTYRPTEDITDPLPIPAPPVAGSYVITADIVNLTYTVVAAK